MFNFLRHSLHKLPRIGKIRGNLSTNASKNRIFEFLF
ncbi:hypothetical protein TcasGA2_TC031395 [Tribolium castaneum]|uniref:Uncharacterized protein n=1 Tax=Tribolium castaneum TaxID=7070 RepID=A0A139WAD0_TRICA|nr:hypothetical protein TcasGA2_TC031395 [Tribolium castaneum]